MSSDEKDLSVEAQQLQPYTVQPETDETFCRNRKNRNFDDHSHNGCAVIVMNLEICSYITK